MINNDSDVKRLPSTFKHDDQGPFLTMVHVALQIRDDMLSHPKPIGLDISTDIAIDCVPVGLYMFLSLLLGSQRLLEAILEMFIPLRRSPSGGSRCQAATCVAWKVPFPSKIYSLMSTLYIEKWTKRPFTRFRKRPLHRCCPLTAVYF